MHRALRLRSVLPKGASVIQRVARLFVVGIRRPVPIWLREDVGLPPEQQTLPEDRNLRWK